MYAIVILVMSVAIRSSVSMSCSCDSSITSDGYTVPSEVLHGEVHSYFQQHLSNLTHYMNFGNTCETKPQSTCDTDSIAPIVGMTASCVRVKMDISETVSGSGSHKIKVSGTYRDCILMNTAAINFLNNRCMSESIGSTSLDLCLCTNGDNCNAGTTLFMSGIVFLGCVLFGIIH